MTCLKVMSYTRQVTSIRLLFISSAHLKKELTDLILVFLCHGLCCFVFALLFQPYARVPSVTEDVSTPVCSSLLLISDVAASLTTSWQRTGSIACVSISKLNMSPLKKVKSNCLLKEEGQCT